MEAMAGREWDLEKKGAQAGFQRTPDTDTPDAITEKMDVPEAGFGETEATMDASGSFRGRGRGSSDTAARIAYVAGSRVALGLCI